MDYRSLPDILRGSRVFIQTHNFPDPDAIGSAYGLREFLLHYGIPSTLCYIGSIERASVGHIIREYGISIQEYGQIEDMTAQDSIVLVDGQKHNANMTDLPGTEVACIYHHPTFVACEYRYRDIRQVGACSSIIAEYFLKGGVPLTKETATMLLYGLQVDTENMTRGVADLDLDVFPALYRAADHGMLDKLAGKSLEFADLRAFGAAIETIRIFGRAGFANIPFPCPDPLIAEIADFILSLAEVDVAVVYAVRDGGLKFSARSLLPEVHSGNMLHEVLSGHGGRGGGHAYMAGGFVPSDGLRAISSDPTLRGDRLRELFLDYIRRQPPHGGRTA